MYQMCGECQTLLAKNHLEFEQEVESTVLEPIHDIIEVIVLGGNGLIILLDIL